MKPKSGRPPRGPFPRPFDVRSLKGEAKRVDLEATEPERAAVAAAVGIPAVAALTASLRLMPRAGGLVEVTGDVRAEITQTCVVTLEPFDGAITQPVGVTFAPATVAVPLGGKFADLEIDWTPKPVGGNDDQEDPPDPIVDDTIDLGAVALEFMVIGLDPYPRKPGVHFADMVVGENAPPAPSAFAALARLKDRP